LYLGFKKFVLKRWGGDLTPLGQIQAENLGTQFRHNMYPDTEGVNCYSNNIITYK
jgi:hypothetical protein